MGGTSTDVCLLAGRPRRSASASASSAGFRSACRRSTCTPSARAAARSSAATRAARSASARESRARIPGPACYGAADAARPSPTRTSCSAGCRRELAGRPRARPRGGRARARRASIPAAVIDVVNAEMLRALRVVSVERGHDPRDFALVAFGGAGPLHACALAEELGIETVLVPEAAGVLSALGLVAGDERRDRVRSYVRPLAEAGELPARGRGRPALPRPVVRADGAAAGRPRRSVPPRARGALRLRRPRAARSSSSRCAPPTSRPGPELAFRQQTRYDGRRAGAPRAARRHLLGAPRLGAGETDGDGTLRAARE